MSKRRKVGDILRKKAGAGYIAEELIIKLVDLNPEDYPPYESYCPICDDPKCREWTNCEIVDDKELTSYCCHVSECEMEDLTQE